MTTKIKPKITLFHCINAFEETSDLSADQNSDIELSIIKMACSGMTKDIFILKAFETGADAVLVLVCPEDACRYAEGNIRAKKRVGWVKKLLDEIGLDGGRLSLHNVALGDKTAIRAIMDKTLEALEELGPNPAT